LGYTGEYNSMSNTFVNQYDGNGSLKDFQFTFNIVQGRSVTVYVTSQNAQADEATDKQPTSSYSVALTDPNAEKSTGTVTFNTAPANLSKVTLTPDRATDVTVHFSNTTPLNQDDLNKAYDQQSLTIATTRDYNVDSNIRYNINENLALVNYKNTVRPLADKAFWRRLGGQIVSQDYQAFIVEVSKDINEIISSYVNASKDNTVLTTGLVGADIGVAVGGNIMEINQDGQVVIEETISGYYSAKAGAHWCSQWAQSTELVTDDYGTTPGHSSHYWAMYSETAAGAASGLIDAIFIKDTVNPVTQIDLIDYSTNEPWINVLENSFSLAIDGILINEPTAYSPPGTGTPSVSYTVTIKENPTLSEPSYITLSAPQAAGTEMQVRRGEAQGENSTMFKTGSNFTPVASSLIASRDLSNVPATTTLGLENLNVSDTTTTKDLTVSATTTTKDLTVSDTITTKDLTVTDTVTTKDLTLTSAPVTALEPSVMVIGADGSAKVQGISDFKNNLGVVENLSSASSSALQSTLAAIPFDDSIPLITEGKECLSKVVTPTKIGRTLVVTFSGILANQSPQAVITVSLFAGDECIGVSANTQLNGAYGIPINFIGTYTVAALDPVTISARFGGNSHTTYFNSFGTNIHKYGGAAKSFIMIEEKELL
jgi:hypothetical protein